MSRGAALAYLKQKGYDDRVIVFEANTATVALAAPTLGVEPGRIAKTLSFLIGDRPILILAEGAARMTGARYRMQPSQNRLDNMVPTPSFDAVYGRELALLGETMLPMDDGCGIGSSDAGNVSQVIPTIQPTICITDGPTPWHTEAAREAARSEKGLASVGLGAKALALTALDLILDPALLRQIKADHALAVAAQ